MSLENNVKKLGRVEYIEPNSLFVKSPGDKVQNGIPQPYEDYSFSVHLRVINGNRYDCGMTGDGEDIVKNVLDYSSDNGTLTFMDGTSMPGQQGYLTTNFTDINMNDPSTNTKECIGIESISIKYDSWYYPTVTIKFVDVRGSSLMQPAEYEYYNNGGPNLGNNNSTSNSQFFKAFFSFPYPLFKLSVKGFYGKEVTYDLSVLKCNIEFNSSTGNYEASANFIGYMYGMYGDLPFPFAYIAPYIDLYGKNTWDEKKLTKDFCYLTTDSNNPVGAPMYTFPELKRVVENASQDAEKEIEEHPTGKEKVQANNLIDKLEKQVMPSFPPKSKNYEWWSWSKTNTKEDSSGYFYIMMNDTNENRRRVFEDFFVFEEKLREYNEMATKSDYFKDKVINTKSIFEDIYNDADKVRKSRGNQNTEATAKTISYDFTDENIATFLSGRVVTMVFQKDKTSKDKPNLLFNETQSSFGSAQRSDYNELIHEIMRRFNENEPNSPMKRSEASDKWTIKAFKLDNIYYYNSFVDTLNLLKKRVNELLKQLEILRQQKIDDTIGFVPSMRNLYNMVFAHVDTFMSCFYNTLDRIRKSIQSDDDSRKYEKLCGKSGDGGIQVDVNENSLKSDSSNGGKLPPFTMFYREETAKDSEDRKFTMVWPGSIPGGDKLDEVKLVEAIINATALKRRTEDSVMPKHNVIYREGDLAPINYYDIIRKSGNPYLDVMNDKTLSDENIVREVVKIFTLRCFYSMLNGSYVEGEDGSSSSVANYTKKAKLIAELEVGNVERAFDALGMSPTQNFVNQLTKMTNDGGSLVGEYLTGDNAIFTANGSAGDLSYNWLKKSEFNCLPVGIFSSSTLQNYAAGANLESNYDKFLKLGKNGTLVNSFCCHLYSGGHGLENALSKYGSGDFKNAAKLFPNYDSMPKAIKDLVPGAGEAGTYPTLPSYRKTQDGITSIFMDPLYYAQTDKTTPHGESKAVEARAYLFLMGIPFDKEKKFFLPETVENGDYPTMLLLREGAVYWRNSFIVTEGDDGAPIVHTYDDPITYEYNVNGVTYNALSDIEANDPCLGEKMATDYFNKYPKNSSEGRKDTLIRYFLKWVNGVDTNPPTSTAADAKVKIDTPSPTMSFQVLEQNLALWEINGTVRQLVTPENAVKQASEVVSYFANAETLKNLYEVGEDDKLGKLNGKIRTDVQLRNRPRGNGVSTDTMLFLNSFRKFYTGTDTVIDFSCLDNPTQNTTVPRSAMNDALSAFVKGLKDSLSILPAKAKDNGPLESTGQPEDKDTAPNYFDNEELKLACYMALKNMYDRWLCSRRRESWYFSCDPKKMRTNNIRSDFVRFFYIDEFYHNIGMQVRPNLTDFVKMTCSEGGFTEDTKESNLAARSIMKILSLTAEEGHCALLTLPTMLGLAKTYTDENYSIEDVFKAFPYNDAVRSDSIETSFIVLYANQKSSVLDVPDDKGKIGYKTDGFDIANTWGEIVPLSVFSDSDENGFVVPCFGVTFAKQNQSYFKNINLSMEDHQVTEFSIRNEVAISYQSNQGPRETTLLGQDLFAVYSNYSYSCNVEMMGDAQITPLMYFQLNNIAMWHGAYMITEVHHDISSRGMETSFKGVRQARPSVPFKDDKMAIPEIERKDETKKEEAKEPDNKTPDEATNTSQRPLDNIDVSKVAHIVLMIDRTTMITGGKFPWVSGQLSARVFYEDGKQEDFTNIARVFEVSTGATGKIEDFSPTTGYFTLPKGRYSKVFVENPPTGQEYRGGNDTFYDFTEGKHITVNDTRLGFKQCEIITGETDYSLFENGEFKNVSLGGAYPIMLYGFDKDSQYDKNEIRATYREIFNLAKRMNEAKKPLTLLITETDTLSGDKESE